MKLAMLSTLTLIACSHLHGRTVMPDRLEVIERHAGTDLGRRLAALGCVAGSILDLEGKEPLVGATVVLEHPGDPASVAITDEQGRFELCEVRPGRSVTTVYYATRTHELGGLALAPGEHAVIAIRTDIEHESAVIIESSETWAGWHAPTIDPTSTSLGFILGRHQLDTMPNAMSRRDPFADGLARSPVQDPP